MSRTELIFQNAAGSGRFWAALMVCAGAAWLITVLMRYERQLVSRKTGAALLLLRLAVLALLLLTFLQPTLTQTADRQRSGRVILAIDVSESMDAADDYATPAELLRWARATGVAGNEAVADRFDEWIAAWESGGEPRWATEAEESIPDRRAELAAIRQQNLEQILDTMRRMPRREVVRRLLTGSPQPFLTALQNVVAVDVRLFAASAARAAIDRTDSLLTDPPPSITRSGTDLALALDASRRAQAAPLAGVIILSDGRHTADTDPMAAAEQLKLLDVPVIPVLIGSDQRPKDISIQSVEFPQVVFLNDSLSVRMRALAAGYSGQKLDLTLTHPDGTQDVRTLSVPVTGPPLLDEQFSLTGDVAGRQQFQITLESRPDESRDDNNTRSFSINVVDDRARVLLIDGEARWDFRFLQTAFSRDEQITETSVVFRQPYLGALPDTFFSRELPFDPQSSDPETSPLADVDLVVVGDVSPEDFDAGVWTLLEHWVRDSGGTLVLTAGRDAMPRAHKAPALTRLLPVSQLRELAVGDTADDALPGDMGFRLALTDDGAAEDMLRLDPDSLTNRRLWQSLPGHPWGLTGLARSSATVLLTAEGLPEDQFSESERTSLLQRERHRGILVHQYYGFGQVLWLGIDDTWRWRHRRGDELHHRFWGQVARWAARNKASAGNDTVRLSLSSTQVETGQAVTVRARWQKQFLDQHPGLKAAIEFFRDAAPPQPGRATQTLNAAETPGASPGSAPPSTKAPVSPAVRNADQPQLRIELAPLEHQPHVFEGVVATLPPGDWIARLVTETGGPDTPARPDASAGKASPVTADLPVEARLSVQNPSTAETSDLTADRDLLSRIAARTRGQLLQPDQIHKALSLLDLPDSAGTVRRERTLWNHPLVMLTFFVLLTTDWILRKLNGLP